jgi:phage gp29-like protein
MGDAIHKGFAPLEIEWTRIGKTRVPELGLKPQRWFQLLPNQPYSNDLRLRDNTADGEPLVPGGWIVHLHQAKPGYIARGALARVLSWPYLFKNYSVRDLAEFLEIYGLPLVMGTYPRGAGSKEKSTLLRAVASIGHAARGIMPEGMAIEIKEAAKGASDPFQAMTEWAERSESKAIIGQVLSSEAKATGMGSGVAALQAEVRDDIMQSDAHQIARSLSQLCMFVAVFNGYTIEPGRAPKYRLIGDDSEDLSTFADSVPKLVHVGAKIPERWIHDRLKIPEPENDEPILQTPAAAAPTPRPATASAALATQPAPEEPQTISDLQSEQLGKNLMPVMDDWIGKIRALVESADSLEAIRDGLLDLYPDLKTDDFTEAMAEALSASALAGRYDILEQAGGLG